MFRGQVGQGDKAREASRLLTWQSEDGGRSWSKPAAPFGDSGRPTSRLDADGVIAFGTRKTCWLAGCDYDWHTLKPNYSSVKVCRSEDGGKTWQPPLTVADLDNDRRGKGIVDKPWLALDRSRGKYRGTVYTAWSRIDEARNHCELRCAVLPPGSRQFAPGVRLGEPIPFKAGNSLIHQVQLAVRPNGTLDAVWRVPPSNRLVHAFSKDGGVTFSGPVPVSKDEATGVGEFPSLAAAPDGKLLVAWSHRGDVYCSVLAAGRWSSPRRIAGVLPEGVRLSYPAATACSEALWVLAYRRENKPERLRIVLYRSINQGKTWEEDSTLASPELPDGKARKFRPGDYVGVAAAKGRLYAAYVLPGEEREELRPRLYVSALGTVKQR
jgi:hypothetical protein